MPGWWMLADWSLVRAIDKVPFEDVVDVRQKDVPKMESAKLSVAPKSNR